MRALAVLIVLAACAAAGLAQKPSSSERQRDLRVEKLPEMERSPATALKIPRSYALVIGIAKYQNLEAKHQLQYSERDAEAMYSILISPEGGNFRAESVHKLIGSAATLANLRRELEDWLPRVARDEDRVLIYFAGHGFVHKGNAFLAPYDIELNNIDKTGYPMASLGQVIGGKIRARWKVLITDACHSGAITPETSNQALNRTLLDLNRSLFSLTASRDRESSYESPDFGGGHGVFTYYVVKGMEGAADESGDGIVTADELGEYARRNVREATGGKQNPTSERGSFDPNMLLAFNPTGVRGAPPPPKFGSLVVEANMDGVEVFVDGKSVGVVSKGAPLKLPGLPPGVHTIKGVKMGYEPDGPREEMVYPGQETTVTIKILIPRRRKQAAVDLFEKGLEYYNKGFAGNYRKAAEQFGKALALDATYSQAALYLARSYHALYDEANAEKFFRRAVEIDPDYLEARASFGGMLLDIGNVDEAIRQLNLVVQHDPKHAMAYYLLAQALRMKEVYPESIAAARKAIALAAANAEPHFWLAESLRMSGRCDEAKGEYAEYLRLSDFDSKLAGKLNYYVLGFLVGKGKKKRAAQQDIWNDLRSLAFFGLCDCERMGKRWDAAIAYCQKSLSYDPQDPFVHFALGLAFAQRYNGSGAVEDLPAARKHFTAMLNINSEMAEAQKAKKYIANIEAALRSQ